MSESGRKITGTIEVLGQKKFDQDCTSYSYIRFIDENKNVVMLKNVIVTNTCDSYLTPGSQLTVYLVELNKAYYLYAVKTAERNVFDVDDMKYIEKQINLVLMQAVMFVVLGLLTAILILGIPVFFIGLWLMFKTFGMKKTANRDNLVKNLRSEGFAV